MSPDQREDQGRCSVYPLSETGCILVVSVTLTTRNKLLAHVHLCTASASADDVVPLVILLASKSKGMMHPKRTCKTNASHPSAREWSKGSAIVSTTMMRLPIVTDVFVNIGVVEPSLDVYGQVRRCFLSRIVPVVNVGSMCDTVPEL